MVKRYYSTLFFLFGALYARDFTTLKEFTAYAERMPEDPEISSSDWSNPDYRMFHKMLLPTFEKRVIEFLRNKDAGIFPKLEYMYPSLVDLFPSLLAEVVDHLQRNVPDGRVIKKVTVDTGASFYIWSELNGAFHSLVRTLNYLEQQGIINNELKIIKPIAHFVFIGDVPNRSPYLIETLFLILRLMEKNPRCEGRSHEKVFYLKGKQEDRQEWLNTGLRNELEVRLANHKPKAVPMAALLSNFFNRLPLALYLIKEGQSTENKKLDALRISYFNPENSELDENSFLYFFDDYARPAISITQKGGIKSNLELKIRAYIYAGNDVKGRIDRHGLSLFKKNGRTEWLVFSSPTGSSRRLYQFFDDAYVRLDIKDMITEWTLTLVHQDSRIRAGFIEDAPRRVISGKSIQNERQQQIAQLQDRLMQLTAENSRIKRDCLAEANVLASKRVSQPVQALPSEPSIPTEEKAPEETVPTKSKSLEHVSDGDMHDVLALQENAMRKLKQEDNQLSSLQGNILKIGSTMDLSKGVKGLSDGYKGGILLKLEDINATGGIHDITLQLNLLDDEYDPQRALENVQKMLTDLNIDLLLAPLGTPTTKAYIDLIEQGKVLVLFPIARSNIFRRPDLINVIQYQQSLRQEADAITRYVYEKHRPNKLAIFYQNDDFGIEPMEHIQHLIKNEMKDLEILTVPYERNTVTFKENVTKIKNFKPDGIALFATSSVVEEFVRQIGIDFLFGKVLFGGSWLVVDQLLKSMQEKGLDLTLISSVPDPVTSDIPLAQEFRKAAQLKGVPLNVIYFEGYLYMSLLAHALEQIEKPYTKTKIIEQFQNLKEYDFKGLRLNFDPETRSITQNVWIYSTSDNSWIQEKVKSIKKN